ncbi:hypothetical protein DHW03_07285 [Pedobacter yonginense]|uniref:Uncharacterized protein n=1 Tax=Pedobacter yonginense TaxID=651869 RepID=A0A317EQN3_9SPHI|nr:hypothetical protein [Pedobacter yonginense]PWS27408.1 hypothetical protein DHW03_07285 [Pedobacter yonginense]
MENQVTNNENALRLFFTEDVFLVEDNSVNIAPEVIQKPVFIEESTPINAAKPSPEPVQNPVIKDNIPSSEPKDYPKPADLPQIVEEPATPIVFKYLGGNQKSVLILVHDTLNDVSTERGRDLLRKIVKAIELTTPDFALVNYANHLGADFTTLHQFFKPQVMLSFGVNADSLKLNVTWQNEIIQHQSTKLIFAPNLDDLEIDQEAKISLWTHLKKLK